MTKKFNFEEITSYCKSKGFFYNSCQIYGGFSGFYDYGQNGVKLKQNFLKVYRKFFLNLEENFVEIDGTNIMPQNVFKGSGHLKNFYDPIVKIDTDNNFKIRADHLIEEKLNIKAEEKSNEELKKLIIENKLLGEDVDYNFVNVENLNLMIETSAKQGENKSYLRPETAQLSFVNFKTQYELLRKKLPLGLMTIGKCYRNEISPRNMLLRTKEVEQAELQIFFNPKKIDEVENWNEIKNKKVLVVLKNDRDEKSKEIELDEINKYGVSKLYLKYMFDIQTFFLEKIGISKDNFRFYELNDKEKAFYNKFHFDIEIFFKSLNSFIEVGGLHYRGDHDLSGHQKISKQNLEVLDSSTNEKILPNVIEISLGIGRNLLSIIDNKLEYDKDKENNILRTKANLSVFPFAVFPLMNKEELLEKSKEIYDNLIDYDIDVIFDKTGNIGKRYFIADEIGIKYCLTIDYDTIEKNEITIRERDSSKQKKLKVEDLQITLKNLLTKKIDFENL